MKIPTALEYWTADEVAECLSYNDPDRVIATKLWGFLSETDDPPPNGGDGSNGTVEEPSGRLDLANGDKTGHWWYRLTAAEQCVLGEAYHREYDTN